MNTNLFEMIISVIVSTAMFYGSKKLFHISKQIIETRHVAVEDKYAPRMKFIPNELNGKAAFIYGIVMRIGAFFWLVGGILGLIYSAWLIGLL